MGGSATYTCRACGTYFTVRGGGGFHFDELHCDACGAIRSVGHQELGDIHFRFVKGLPAPYAVSRRESDARIQRDYPGEPLSEEEYHAAVEGTLERCACGGRFRYDAPPRCPSCRSTKEQWDWDKSRAGVLYD